MSNTNEAPSLEMFSGDECYEVMGRVAGSCGCLPGKCERITAAPAPQEEWLREAERLADLLEGAVRDSAAANAAGLFSTEYCEGMRARWEEAHTALLAHLAKRIAPASTDAQIERRWPFVESPGEFTRRLCNARDLFGGDMLAAVRNVLIENPPVRATPSPEGSAVGNGADLEAPLGRWTAEQAAQIEVLAEELKLPEGDSGVHSPEGEKR